MSRDARCRERRERDAPAGQPVAHELHVQGAVDRRGRRCHRDRETVRAHLPGAETVGPEDGLDCGHFRQRRSEEPTELSWAEEVLEVQASCDQTGT